MKGITPNATQHLGLDSRAHHKRKAEEDWRVPSEACGLALICVNLHHLGSGLNLRSSWRKETGTIFAVCKPKSTLLLWIGTFVIKSRDLAGCGVASYQVQVQGQPGAYRVPG